MSGPWGIVLDANLMLRSGPRDLFLYLAAGGILEPLWSEEILTEVARNFPGGAERFGPLEAVLRATFPHAVRYGFQQRLVALVDTHPKDRHVMALAAEHEADIVSFNVRDFGGLDAIAAGVAVLHPDDALVRLAGRFREAVLLAVEKSFRGRRNPPVTWEEFLSRLERDELRTFGSWLRALGPAFGSVSGVEAEPPLASTD